MSRILVTGSADRLGRLTAQSLLSAGHDIAAHVRNHDRAAALSLLLHHGPS